MSKLEMFAKASGYGLAFHGPVLIQLWQEGTPDQGAMKAVEAAEALSRQQHTKVGSLIIVTEHASLPSPRARSILADLPSRARRGGLPLGRGAGRDDRHHDVLAGAGTAPDLRKQR